MESSATRLFVSYAHVDESRIGEMAALLRAGGFDPWWDDRLEPGDDWKAELRDRIEASDAFLYLLSQDSVESEWCGWELAQAVALGKPIVPILVRAGTQLPASVSHLQYLDLSRGLENRDVARLVGKLARLKQAAPSVAPAAGTPSGLPSRFRRPLPRHYKTLSQAYLQPLGADVRLHQWQQEFPIGHSSSKPIIGIDFGTTISSVAVYTRGASELIPNDVGETSTPSAIAFSSDGTPLVGEAALDLLLLRPERGVLEVKRLLGHDLARPAEGQLILAVDGVAYTPIHLVAFILRQLRRYAEVYLDSPVDAAVLTAPAYFDSAQSAALVEAASLAGLQVLRVLPEPVAACMAIGWALEKETETALVYDLGGGTFDTSVIECGDGICEVLAVSGDTQLGGADFDRILVDYCLEEFERSTGLDLRQDATALIRLRWPAERAKVALATERMVSISVPFVAATGSTPVHLDVKLTRTRCNELTHGLVARTLELCLDALGDAGESSSTIDKVLVVGRASRAASIREALEDLFGHRLTLAPDHIVALGAAVQGGVLGGLCRTSLLLDCVVHTLRVELAGGRATPVVVRNSTIPLDAAIGLQAGRPDGRTLLVRLLTGESSWASQNQPLCEMAVPLDTSGAAESELKVTVDIDASSLIQVKVWRDCMLLAEHSVSLRQDTANTELAACAQNRFNVVLPTFEPPVRLEALSDAEATDAGVVLRWLCSGFRELVLQREWVGGSKAFAADLDKQLALVVRGADSGGPFPDIWRDLSFERELLVDALEEYFKMDLPAVRRSASLQAAAKTVVRAVGRVHRAPEGSAL